MEWETGSFSKRERLKTKSIFNLSLSSEIVSRHAGVKTCDRHISYNNYTSKLQILSIVVHPSILSLHQFMTSGGDLETIIGQVASLLQGKDRQLFTLTSIHTQFWIANEPKMHVFGLWEEARLPGSNPSGLTFITTCKLHTERPQPTIIFPAVLKFTRLTKRLSARKSDYKSTMSLTNCE